MNVDGIIALVFVALLGLFLWKRRKKLELKKFLWPILYVVMYRDKFGLDTMDFWARKARSFFRILGYLGIVAAFVGMAFICIELIIKTFELFTAQAVPSVQPVLPIQADGVFYVPFLYWVLSIFVVAVVHEFGHGVIARVHKIPLKSTGFAFLSFIVPVLPAAFVEPDETTLMHRAAKERLSVYAAGPFANILVGLLFLCILLCIAPLSAAMFEPAGVEVSSFTKDSSAAAAGLEKGMVIVEVDDKKVKTVDDLKLVVSDLPVDDVVVVDTLEKKFTFNPNIVDDKAMLGVRVRAHHKPKLTFVDKYPEWLAHVFRWFAGLFSWIFLLNIGIGLFNLLPIGPLDGGHMSRVALTSMFKNRKTALKIWAYVSLFFISVILVNLFFGLFA